MVVNSASRFLQRCKAAQAMHGTASAATSQNYSETIRATDQTIVHDAPSRGSSSNCMGSEDHGRNMPTRKGSDVLLDRGGQGTGRRCADEKVMNGWSAWGEHPWWIVHDKPEKTMARYNSDSMLEVKDGTLEEYVDRRGGWSHVPSPPGNRPVEQQRHV